MRALGTTAVVATADAAAIRTAKRELVRGLRAFDVACSRFRTDSELTALNNAGGRATPASALLRRAVTAAMTVAEATGGLVDPTVGRAIRLAGYDRTFVLLTQRDGTPIRPTFEAAGRWREITVDETAGTVRIPQGVELDLGATAKALAADEIAAAAFAACACGVLISIGGDVSVAGPSPEGGWSIGIADSHAAEADAVQTSVSITTGGLASSSTTVRRWASTAGELHHLLDPATGQPARSPWTTVSVAAASCLDANAASTAAVILGAAGPDWLARHGLSSRLRRRDGSTVVVAGWPADAVAA